MEHEYYLYCNACGRKHKATRDNEYHCKRCQYRGSWSKRNKNFCMCCGKEVKLPRKVFCSPECALMKYERTEEQKFELLRKYRQRKSRVTIYFNVLYECRCENKKKENHHFDYSRPLEVIRLCSSCHKNEHKRLRSLVADRKLPKTDRPHISAAGR
jgi:hypothetical protein